MKYRPSPTTPRDTSTGRFACPHCPHRDVKHVPCVRHGGTHGHCTGMLPDPTNPRGLLCCRCTWLPGASS